MISATICIHFYTFVRVRTPLTVVIINEPLGAVEIITKGNIFVRDLCVEKFFATKVLCSKLLRMK